MGLAVRVLAIGAAVLALATPAHANAKANANANAHPEGSGLRLMARVTGRAAPARAAESPTCAAGLVALTFDDGPVRGLTPKLVRILEDRHVPATFFMVGGRVHRSPRVARFVARAGFPIGNHTWSHPQLTRLSDRAIRHEIRSTARELRRDGIPRSTLMRPPYGDIDARVRADIRDLGLVPVLWNVDSNDWRGGTARQIARSILAQLRRHRDNIVLQHDGVTNSPASVAAVPRVIREARRRGYCFGRLGPHGHVLPPGSDQAAPVPSPARVPAGPAHAVVVTPFGAASDRTWSTTT